MAVKIIGTTSGVEVDSDTNKNLFITDGLPAHPSAGGYYTVSGGTSAVIAATLATDTVLMAMRFSASSTRKAYVSRLRCLIGAATVGTSALVAGSLGLQRFTTATPTGGTARTPNELAEALATATDMTDVRDSNAALTVTSVVFGNEIARTIVPLFIASGALWMEWIVEPKYPITLVAGDGLCLRTRVVMPGTQTWQFSYTFHWEER
jgi:hypothetical protein